MKNMLPTEPSTSMKMKNDNRIERGFSIIEMLIAIVVITVGLGSVISVAIYVSRANMVSNTMSVITTAAQDQVDRLHAAAWTSTAEDPSISAGGSIPVTSENLPDPSIPGSDERGTSVSASELPFLSGGIPVLATATVTQNPSYVYTQDPLNSHHATASNTSSGNLDIYWSVRQGPTADIRYVTVKVLLPLGPPMFQNGYTVSTILTRK